MIGATAVRTVIAQAGHGGLNLLATTFMRDNGISKRRKCLGVIAMLAVPSSAYADDPTGVLLQERRAAESPAQHQHGQAPAFSDVGPCQPGTQSEPFPSQQGFRCIPNQ